MFEQDYIMRMIKEMVRFMLKLLFHIDTDSPTADLLEKEEKGSFNELLNRIEEGDINGAEERLFEMMDTDDMNHLKMALLFYFYLNNKSDEYLEEHNFTRDEIKSGIQEVTAKYGIQGMEKFF